MPDPFLNSDRSLSPMPAYASSGGGGVGAPSFHMMESRPPQLRAVLLGGVASLFALAAVMHMLGHGGRVRPGGHSAHDGQPARSAPSANGAASGVPSPGDDSDSDFDTIVLGDPADAPAPARRGNGEPSPVHPFAVVRLPRFGEESGLIPDTVTGHVLYSWLAAFNHGDAGALAAALRTADAPSTAAAEVKLFRETGGFLLLSAKEVAPGVMVFRLRDQTTQTEALGTLRLSKLSPPTVGSFSLRGIGPS